METETLEAERILIYKNDSEINRVTRDGQVRADLLNKLNAAGVDNNEIPQVTQSLQGIDEYILKRQLSENKKLKELHAAGIKAEAALSPELVSLSFTLKAWQNIRSGNKLEHLVYADTWLIDEQALEKYLVRRGLKIYVQDERLIEYNSILSMCEFLKAHKAEPGQIRQAKFFSDRIEHTGNYNYVPKWTHFRTNR